MKKSYDKSQLKEFVKNNGIKTADDLNITMKDLFKDLVEVMLEGEMDDHLGYDKYDYSNKETENSRNGNRSKKVKSSFGELLVNIPRDRKSSFEPDLIPKYSRDISSEIEDKIISMYSRGMSTRDINEHIEDIYGMSVSAESVSKITDKVIETAKEWQARPLESLYTFVFLDAIHYNVRTNGKVVKRAVYVVIGINIEGRKEILGLYVGENESSKFWLSVLTDLKNRGVKDILIASVDGLTGFPDAISSIYKETEIQRCIVHQIRNTSKYISWKEKKEFLKDLKEVYTSSNEEIGYETLQKVQEKWKEKYPYALKSWFEHWTELSTFFSYSPEIRKIMYTTNIIENLNRQYRKITKTRQVFPTDISLLKILYLATERVSKKWTMPIRNWNLILGQLGIHFGERLDI